MRKRRRAGKKDSVTKSNQLQTGGARNSRTASYVRANREEGKILYREGWKGGKKTGALTKDAWKGLKGGQSGKVGPTGQTRMRELRKKNRTADHSVL